MTILYQEAILETPEWLGYLLLFCVISLVTMMALALTDDFFGIPLIIDGIIVIILLMKIQYKERLQKIFKFIGERSLETYLIHGMSIHFCNKYSFFPQNYIYTMQVLILTILIACLLYYIDKKIKFLLN